MRTTDDKSNVDDNEDHHDIYSHDDNDDCILGSMQQRSAEKSHFETKIESETRKNLS